MMTALKGLVILKIAYDVNKLKFHDYLINVAMFWLRHVSTDRQRPPTRVNKHVLCVYCIRLLISSVKCSKNFACFGLD